MSDAHQDIQNMEIREKNEAFVEEDGDLVFDHTKLIFRRDGEYFYAISDLRSSSISPSDIGQLDINKIPPEHIWPPMESHFTSAPDPLPLDSYFKQPSLLQYDDSPASQEMGHQVLTDVKACEILRNHPHPNIAQYLGCVVVDGRIIGLCFNKYPMTLRERLSEEAPFDRAKCLQGIESGIKHMHEMGLIHNDLNPSNIMIEKNDNPVIIDFDSCQREGDKLGRKAGTYGWTLDESVTATRENDFFSLSKLRDMLLGAKEGE